MQEVEVSFPAGVDLAAFAQELAEAMTWPEPPPFTYREAEDDAGDAVVVIGDDVPAAVVLDVAGAHVPPAPGAGSFERLVADLEAAGPANLPAIQAALLAWARGRLGEAAPAASEGPIAPTSVSTSGPSRPPGARAWHPE